MRNFWIQNYLMVLLSNGMFVETYIIPKAIWLAKAC